jgi:hypothetical protein
LSFLRSAGRTQAIGKIRRLHRGPLLAVLRVSCRAQKCKSRPCADGIAAGAAAGSLACSERTSDRPQAEVRPDPPGPPLTLVSTL